MQDFSITPKTIFVSMYVYRQLIVSLIHREVVGRYRGSFLGILWSFLNPIFMLVVYTFVFSIVFKAHWAGIEESRAVFALVLFAGLLIFNLFAECVTRAPSLILSHSNYVKKVVFPLEILPVVILGAAFFHALVSFLVWMIFFLIVVGLPPLTILLLPLAMLPLTFFIMGFSWLLASLGVYLRDTTQFVGIVVTTLMFLSPIFYPVSAIPAKYRPFIYSNPLAFIIEQVRNILIFGVSLDWFGLVWMTGYTLLFAWGGFAWFQKTRKGFADVL